MNTTSLVVRLWAMEQLPGWDGLYRSDGRSRVVIFDPSLHAGHALGTEFEVAARLEDEPEWVATILGTTRSRLPDGSGELSYGDCAHGSEGYFARLDTEGRLVWVVYFEESNPFVKVSVSGSMANFTTNLGVDVLVDLNSPEFGLEPLLSWR